jgi:hypothetical protein
VHVGLLGGGEVQLADGESLLLLAAGELGGRGELSFNAFATTEATLAATAEAVTALKTGEIEASIRGEGPGSKVRPVPATFLMFSAVVVGVLGVGVALVRDPPRASGLGHGEKRNESDRNGLHVECVVALERQTEDGDRKK